MVTGTLLICPRCDSCVELLGEAPRPQELDDFRCDCGAQFELPAAEPYQPISHLDYRGG